VARRLSKPRASSVRGEVVPLRRAHCAIRPAALRESHDSDTTAAAHGVARSLLKSGDDDAGQARQVDVSAVLLLPSVPIALGSTRVVALWPLDREEVGEWLIDRARTLLYPLTRSRPAPDELVLLDLRLDGDRLWLPATTRYTVPDGRGPIFACGPRQRAALARLVGGALEQRREHVRLPLALPALVRLAREAQPAVSADLSVVGARLHTLLPLQLDAIEIDFPPPRPEGFPPTVSARVIARRGDDAIVRFVSGGGWRELRWWLRRVDESGVMELPASSLRMSP
jgi:hypothetical protein